MEEYVVKLMAVIWDAYAPLMRCAAAEEGVDLTILTMQSFEDDPGAMDMVDAALKDADLILINRTHHPFWDEFEGHLKAAGDGMRVISVGNDPIDWEWCTVDHDVAITAYRYMINSGMENYRRLLRYLRCYMGEDAEPPLPPLDIPWQGIVHPELEERVFDSTEEYLNWYRAKPGAPWVGVIMPRTAWSSNDCGIDHAVIRDLEGAGCNVIPFFTMSHMDEDRGSIGIAGSVRRYLMKDGKPRIDAIVKLISFLMDSRVERNVDFLKELNIPIFQPAISYRASLEEWEMSPGLSSDVSWTVAMPEFEGVIEPLMIGATRKVSGSDYDRTVIPDRSRRLAQRVRRHIEMGRRPVRDRRFVFVLNNNPCAGLEANIGAAAHLDSLESVARILNRMRDQGYSVTPPKDGSELVKMILDRKALSEFRWTSIEEIVRCGGAIHRMGADEYRGFFSTLSPEVRERVNATWGEPPGKGMVLDGDLIITGVSFGNAVVIVQPKRGCYGSRCDGEVCKILHDPECPPTHQYLATYHYYGDVFNADAFIHVGTHGNLEFLPGKGVGLSGDCFPDISIGTTPNIYIYNSDNPPEGTTAKRRSLATLIDHMQTVMTESSLYDEFSKLDDLLAQYETAQHDPARCHALRHAITDAVMEANLTELDASDDLSMDEMVRRCHEALSRIRNSQMDSGMHIFGEMPEGDDRVEMINSVLRYDAGAGTPGSTLAELMGVDLDHAYANQGLVDPILKRSYGALIEQIGARTKDLIRSVLDGATVDDAVHELGYEATPEQMERMSVAVDRIMDLDRRISDSDEMEALFNSSRGGFTPPGPSGPITRGRVDVLPSGRNFYSLDPYRVPTTSAWRVGTRLADAVIEKYKDEEGEMPENVAFYWMSSDVMSADGEMMAEILSLLGVRAVWQPNGQVRGFEVIPISDLTHPRIDVTIRVSGILRDNFVNCMDLVDSAIREVAVLDEPIGSNFVRKHFLDSISKGASEDEATARLFSAKAGTYASGVNLAVLASAWKDEKDLAEIYVSSNGYAYGNSRNGMPMHEQFADNLSTVSLTLNNTISDEYDLLGCCCYFGNQGGLTVAAKHLSGKDVKAYYGDTREPHNIGVSTLADELRRVVRTKLLNPKWIDGMKEHGYKGASDMMKKVTRVYGWEASTQMVDDWIFDDIAKTFIMDEGMRGFFEENNPYALEEIARRLLEAQSRGLWDADEDLLQELRSAYVLIESWMEERAGEGDIQGGSVDMVSAPDVDGWGGDMAEIMDRVHGRLKHGHD